MGGLAIMAGIMVSIVLSQLLVTEFGSEKLMIFYFMVLVHGLFGLIDDLINIGRKIKVLAPYFMALPVILLVHDTSISSIFGSFELGSLYLFLVAPVYVMVVSNLMNMHEGYNGLSAGLSSIILFFIGIKVLMTGSLTDLFYILPLFGALLAFLWFNLYPAKIFLGNSGTLLVGAGIGGLLIVYKLEVFGIIILMPHIINFLMWMYWVLNMKKIPHVKFAKLRKDGTIEPPNGLTIKYLVAKIFRVNEPQAVALCYLITIAFGVVALVIG